jgi:hypothetical protein
MSVEARRPVVIDVIDVIAAAVWAALTVAYLGQGRRQILADLRDGVGAPFTSLTAWVPHRHKSRMRRR